MMYKFGFAVAAASSQQSTANPIRRVVSLLQGLEEKVKAEGEKAEKLYAKFQCYCQSNEGKLDASIEEALAAIDRLTHDIESTKAQETQARAAVYQSKEDRAAAQDALEKSEKMRAKEAGQFASDSGDLKANLEALASAVTAIEKGMSSAFLQTDGASAVSRLAQYSTVLTDEDKQAVAAFLQGGEGYAPASGQIVGILKQMGDEMKASLNEITTSENEAIASYNGMVAAKNKEITASTAAIEEQSARAGDLAVEVVTKTGDLKETKSTLAADKGFLAGLKDDCAKTAKEQEAATKTRGEELVAIADTIKMLNSDEALDLFKKTLPSPSLLQLKTTRSEVTQRVVAALQSLKHSPHADLILMALRGKKEGFEKVAALVDKMMASLKEEQKDDDEKVAFCKAEIDKTEDEAKELKNKLHSTATRITAAEDTISTTKSEIAGLDESIKELDAAVEQATSMRKEEHEDYTTEAADNNAALQLLGMAKNRLNKFYHPKAYKEPEQEEEEEAFVQIRSHRDEPAAAPEVQGHSKSDTGGVVGLMDMLIQDLKKEMQENEFVEKNAQEDYESLVADSKAKRAADASARSEKKGTLAEAEAELLDLKGSQRDIMSSAESTGEYLAQLHGDCDWNIDNYGARKSARAEELESLKKAKDIINGADFSLLQTRSGATLLNKARRA